MRSLTFFLFLFLSAPWVQAHELEYRYGPEQALVVTIADEDGHGFAFKDYTVHRANEEAPYQTGRTDGLGRIAFLPDRAGEWRIRAVSADGHGIDFMLRTDAAGLPAPANRSPLDRYGRLSFGVALILALFASLGLYLKRTRAHRSLTSGS